MRDIDDAVDHVLDRGDAREKLGGLLRFLDSMSERLVQGVRALQHARSHVVARHIPMYRVANVHQPMCA